MTATNRSRGHRAGLTQPDVLAAAHEVLRLGAGTDLSLRAVAARLGVAPNAIYSYYPSRDALVDAVLDDALAAVATPSAGVQPLDGLRAVMLDSYDVLLGQQHLVRHYLARSGSRGEQAWRLGECMLGLLRDAGLPLAAARVALQVLIVQAIGFASFDTAAATSGATKSPRTRRREFAQALDWLLSGIGLPVT